MAYANLVDQNCAGFTEEAFQRIRDFICKRNGTYDYSTTGIGWTLHDSHYATDEDNCAIGDWFVVKSVGESGDEDLYYKITWYAANNINIHGMLYWDAATDTAYKTYGSTSAQIVVADDDLAFPIWIYGDLDQVIIGSLVSSVYHFCSFGRTVDLPYDDTVATCSSSLSSGNDVSITVDAIPGEWAVDRYLFIRDNAEIDKIKIKTLDAGTKTITADLAHNFSAGSKLCADMYYQCSYSNQITAQSEGLINHNEAESVTCYKKYSDTIDYCNPDDMNAELIGGEILLGLSSVGFFGKLKNIYKIADGVAGVNSEDVYTDFNSVDWRVFNAYSTEWIAIKEV